MNEPARVKILIVDDVKANLLALRETLKGLDVEVLSADSGNEALAKLLDHEFACIVLDVRMPEMDGFELAKIIRTDDRTKYIPIIFASGHKQTEIDVFTGYETGAVDYLLKPLNPMIVRSKVHIFADLYRKELNQRRIEARLAEFAKELQRSNAELDQFASVVAHDLKAPLRTMKGFSEMVRHACADRIDTQSDKRLTEVIESAERMTAMVDDLLMYSKVGRQHTVVEVTPTDLLSEVIRDLSKTIEEAKAKIEYEPMSTMIANPTEMRQLFQNLIANAIKYRNKDTNPKISIRLNKNKDFWIFSFADNGIGIDANLHDRLFKIFSRLCDVKEYPGTGIGLATCKKIVERHGGKIWIESALGQGSTFYFTIPLVPQPMSA